MVVESQVNESEPGCKQSRGMELEPEELRQVNMHGAN